MGQSYCQTCCADKHVEIPGNLQSIQQASDEPKSTYAKCVKHYIDIHPKVKQVFLSQRDAHFPCRRGTKLPLYYLFEFAAYYEGQWKNGLPHGYGRLIYDDGSVYEGCFKYGTAQCQIAVFIKENGSYYRGNVLNNKAHGKGVFVSDTICYEGSWIEDYPHGQGRESYSRNSYYEGSFIRGKKHGSGEYYWSSDEYYNGQFRNNNMDGWGTYKSRESEYVGSYKNGLKSGKGTLKNLAKGWEYIGDFLNDKLHGRGVYIWGDGTKFEGQFENNKKTKGKLILANGQEINNSDSI